MKRITEYRIISAVTAGRLQDAVEQAIKDGWELWGGVSVSDGTFYQAVVWADYE